MNNHPTIFLAGIIGTHGIGKSTFANALHGTLLSQTKHESTRVLITRINYADHLRDLLGNAWPHRPNHIKTHPLERQVLEATGEVHRTKNRNYFINHFNLALQRLTQNHQSIIINIADDVYHFNEAFQQNHITQINFTGHEPQPLNPHEYRSVARRETSIMLTTNLLQTAYENRHHIITAQQPEKLQQHINPTADRILRHVNEILLASSQDTINTPTAESAGELVAG